MHKTQAATPPQSEVPVDGLLADIADVDGPYLVSKEFGRERSVRHMIEHFYASHDMKNFIELAAEYIEKHGS
ncbi:MAG: hypothetical protein ACYS1A_18820 [Planctomycetota bacterium]